MNKARRLAAGMALPLLILVSSLSAGCSGGRTDQFSNVPVGLVGNPNTPTNPSNPTQTREAIVTAVRSVRSASVQLQKAREAAPFSTRQQGDIEFDEDYGLYSRFTTSGNGTSFRIDYFTDAAATRSAGFTEVRLVSGNPGTYPFTYRITSNITAGNEPVEGTATFTFTSATSGRYSGSYTDRTTGERTTFSASFNADGYVVDELEVNDDGRTLDFSNISFQEDGSLTADLSTEGLTGTVRLAGDESGTLTINTTSGQIVATWNAAGVGTIRYPDGTVINISDFDTAEA